MPKLYVANPTHQVHQFTYRLPDTPRHLIQEIPIGGQVLVAGRELPVPVIDGILEQHRRFGLISSNEAQRAPTFSGLVYSVDKAVPLTVLYALIDKLKGLLADRGRQAQRAAAIATNEYIQDAMQQANIPGRMNELEVTLEEVSRDPRDTSPEVHDGIRVVPDVQQFEREHAEAGGGPIGRRRGTARGRGRGRGRSSAQA